MKRSSATILSIVVIVAILVVGGFLLFHDPGKSTSDTSTNSTNSSGQSSDAVIITKTDSSLGKYLATAKGQPLYTYDKDTAGVSNCTGACLSNWPAYVATGSTSNLPSGVSTIKRTDNGKTQYAYKDKPLYTFSGDSNGQVSGDGVENFSLAKVSTAPSSSSNQSDTTPSQSSNNSPY